ncbi:beta-lactamase superfamily domain-containing protein [Microdochium trichocladiopsis]|uniref:Beta-lactamase superfamily domain-containing protein n=1 Tax=Microdochium trichocladiopsis TaxID=1682393 RepID=A0A9P9C080_9PEZI|nr:beta-lactamase superfamily domain-containing protein [Microdochium trichocladiopsis]KAH7040859.1 beta-lactamase superfamily domain-containing protein [Microdochium trichocladiopsis]
MDKSASSWAITPPSSFKASLAITHIGSATTLITITAKNGAKNGNKTTFLTDPIFSPAGTAFPVTADFSLVVQIDPALSLSNLPPIDAVLLSHEDHPDHIDAPSRQLLHGRQVFTTPDGAAVIGQGRDRGGLWGLRPWESVTASIGGSEFTITGTPCEHLPGGEVTGFVITTSDFGEDEQGRPHAVWFSGDTLYLPEAHRQLKDKYNILVAIVNLGGVMIDWPPPLPAASQPTTAPSTVDVDPATESEPGKLQTTMDGKQAAQLCKDLEVSVLVPVHYEGWLHYTQSKESLVKDLEDEGVAGRVCWLPGGGEARRVI